MGPFGVAMRDILAHRAFQRTLSEEDHPVEALRLDAPHEPLGVRVQVRAPRRQLQWDHAFGVQRRAKRRTEFPVAVQQASQAVELGLQAGKLVVSGTDALLDKLKDEEFRQQFLDALIAELARELRNGSAFGRGLLKGFFVDGLWGTLEGIGSLLKFAYQYNPVALAAHDLTLWEFESYDDTYAYRGTTTALSVAEAAVEGAPYLAAFTADMFELLADMPTLARGRAGDIEALLTIDSRFSDETKLIIDTSLPVIEDILAFLGEKLLTLTEEEWSELAGRVTGFVLYTAAEMWGTAAIGTAIKAGAVSTWLYRMQKFPGVKWLDDFVPIRNALARLADDIAYLLKTRVCFVAGTKVHTPDGFKNIEDIEAGDLVLTRAESDGHVSDAPLYKPVVRTFETHPEELWRVTLRTEDDEEEPLLTTAGHPFYVVEEGRFVHASDLKIKNTLSLPGGRTARVLTLRREEARPGGSFTTYNIAVAETHTYFVGRAGVWVHNLSSVPCKTAAGVFLKHVDDVGAEQAARLMRQKLDGMPRYRGDVDRHYRDALAMLREEDKLSEDVYIRLLQEHGRDLERLATTATRARRHLTHAMKDVPHNIPASATPSAHHIVPIEEFNKPWVRRLREWGIDLNGKDNGVWLPQRDYPGRVVNGRGPSLHSGGHTDEYLKYVRDKLELATSREHALGVLDEIRQELLNGTLKINGAT
jgi:hypothetical protein